MLPPGWSALIPSVHAVRRTAGAGRHLRRRRARSAPPPRSAGPAPNRTAFTGPVYLTGPYERRSLRAVDPDQAAAGPFDLGTRASRGSAIGVDQHTGRVIATTSDLPTIVGGVPLRLRSISVAVNRGQLPLQPDQLRAAVDRLAARRVQLGATRTARARSRSANCRALPFKPAFAAATSPTAHLESERGEPRGQPHAERPRGEHPLGRRLAAEGAALAPDDAAEGLPGSDVRGASPYELPGRLESRQRDGRRRRCCRNKLTGPAYLVSHGGAAFPDLDLILEGDHGVNVILEGNTRHQKRDHDLDVRLGPRRAGVELRARPADRPELGARRRSAACASKPLLMPTTITAQSGAVIKQSTRIAVAGSAAARSSAGAGPRAQADPAGAGLRGRTRPGVSRQGSAHRFRKVRKPATFTIKVPLSRDGLRALGRQRRHHRRLKLKVRVGFAPSAQANFHLGQREGRLQALACDRIDWPLLLPLPAVPGRIVQMHRSCRGVGGRALARSPTVPPRRARQGWK